MTSGAIRRRLTGGWGREEKAEAEEADKVAEQFLEAAAAAAMVATRGAGRREREEVTANSS